MSATPDWTRAPEPPFGEMVRLSMKWGIAIAFALVPLSLGGWLAWWIGRAFVKNFFGW